MHNVNNMLHSTASYINILKWTLNFPGIDHNFLKLKKAVVCVLDARESLQFAQQRYETVRPL